MSKPRFMILTASTGNGHTSAANALRDRLHELDCDAVVVNVMDHVVKAFRRWFQGGYEMLVRRGPNVWGTLYKTSDKPFVTYGVQTLLDAKCSYPLDQIIRDYRPDWIVNTHSVAQPRLPKLKEELGCGVAVVVTDLYPHRMWLRGKPDHFFVPNEYTRDVLESRIPYIKGHVDITGIPVNAAFSNPLPKPEAKTKFGLDEKPAILVSSGGIGAGPFDEVVERLSELDAAILVVCGRSQEAFDRVTKSFGENPHVKIFGHVTQTDMAALMASSEMIVGKSGGLTTFEALAVGCPFVVYMPFLIPGQEEDNAKWLRDAGAGIMIKNIDELVSTVNALLADPERRHKMSEKSKALSKPDATNRIVDRLIELCGVRHSEKSGVLLG